MTVKLTHAQVIRAQALNGGFDEGSEYTHENIRLAALIVAADSLRQIAECRSIVNLVTEVRRLRLEIARANRKPRAKARKRGRKS